RGPNCQALRKDDGPCGATATAASGYRWCWFHSPEDLVSDDAKALAVSRGGNVTARKTGFVPAAPDPRLEDPESISTFIREVAGMALRGDVAPSVAVALTGLANAALKAYTLNLGRKLADLEEIIAERARPVRAIGAKP